LCRITTVSYKYAHIKRIAIAKHSSAKRPIRQKSDPIKQPIRYRVNGFLNVTFYENLNGITVIRFHVATSYVNIMNFN